MNKSTKHGFWHGFNLAAIILIAIFVFGVPLLFAFAEFVSNVGFSLKQEAEAVLEQPVALTVEIDNSSNHALNAVEFELSYDPAAVMITAIVPHETLCEKQFVIANTFDNATGTALFQCGTHTPFEENRGTIATVYVLPLRSGTTSIAFANLTHVIAHDGLGTDATGDKTGLMLYTN
jgi:hypothetical protein